MTTENNWEPPVWPIYALLIFLVLMAIVSIKNIFW